MLRPYALNAALCTATWARTADAGSAGAKAEAPAEGCAPAANAEGLLSGESCAKVRLR
jgi:hypothetical protein